jgi:transposase
VDAVVWVARTGVPWRDLGEQFGVWKSIYNRFRNWAHRGWWAELFRGCEIEEEVASILDASIVRAHQDSAGGRGGPEANGLGRSRGGFSTKMHAVVTLDGKPIEIRLTPGQRHEATVAEGLLDFVRGRNCIADGGYDADWILEAARQRGLKPVIPSSKCRKRKRRMNRALFKLRYRVEVFFHALKRFRRIATRYDKTAVCYLSFLHVGCTMLSI